MSFHQLGQSLWRLPGAKREGGSAPKTWDFMKKSIQGFHVLGSCSPLGGQLELQWDKVTVFAFLNLGKGKDVHLDKDSETHGFDSSPRLTCPAIIQLDLLWK